MAVVGTALIAGLSYAMAPGAWLDWIAVLERNVGATGTWAAIPIPLTIRLPIAVAVIVWAARGDRRWALPIGCLLAMPVIWYGSLTFLLASVALMPRTVVDRVRGVFVSHAADGAGAV